MATGGYLGQIGAICSEMLAGNSKAKTGRASNSQQALGDDRELWSENSWRDIHMKSADWLYLSFGIILSAR